MRSTAIIAERVSGIQASQRLPSNRTADSAKNAVRATAMSPSRRTGSAERSVRKWSAGLSRASLNIVIEGIIMRYLKIVALREPMSSIATALVIEAL